MPSIGKVAKKDSSPATANVQEKPLIIVNDAVDAVLSVPLEVVAASVVAAPKESPKNTAHKEKSNKKKRNDALLVQQLGNFDDKSNHFVMPHYNLHMCFFPFSN